MPINHHPNKSRPLSMPSTPSYLLSRSLNPQQQSTRPSSFLQSLEHIDISSFDTPTNSLRNEILIGFLPRAPHSLISLSRPEKSSHGGCELRLWEFHPNTRVKLLQRLVVDEEGPEYLPIAVASTCFVGGGFSQVLYRCAGDDGEACIEVRYLPLQGGQGWRVWECVTEEDGLFGGICFNHVQQGFITVATASRVYFFTAERGKVEEDGEEETEKMEEWWSRGKGCIIFEVDLYLQRHLPLRTTKYATRLISSSPPSVDNPSNTSSTSSVPDAATIIVFTSQKASLQSFKLEIIPSTRTITVTAQTSPINWKSEAKGALLAWSMGRKLMMSHCCENECTASGKNTLENRVNNRCRGGDVTTGNGEGSGGVEVFKSWDARGKGSLKELVWDYGGVVLDYWDK